MTFLSDFNTAPGRQFFCGKLFLRNFFGCCFEFAARTAGNLIIEIGLVARLPFLGGLFLCKHLIICSMV